VVENHLPLPEMAVFCFDPDSESKSLAFLGVKFKCGYEPNGKERYLSVGLSVYNDGLARISHNGIISRAASPENTFTLDDPGQSALLPRRQIGHWTPIAAIRLCTSR
jgi:hypothetical protein